jgi:PhzF family phenazine biosynthesis protein
MGNGLAVVVDGDGLAEDAMRRFAAWTNLAETTFLLAPSDPAADYRVRIFTPAREMPFAGHPTLGSCAAWLHAGGQPARPGVVVQQCAIGLVEIDLAGPVPAFVAPPTTVEPLAEAALDRLCAALELSRGEVVRSARLDNGPTWQVLELESAERVLAIDAARVRWPDHVGVAVLGPHPAGSECDHEIRSLSPSSGMSEDPVTGSLNAAVAQWMRREDRLPSSLTIAQGTRVGREGRVCIRRDPADATRVLIGGESRVLIDGSLTL